MGTRLVATKDSPYHERYLAKLMEANDTGTVIIGRSVGKVRRVLKTEYSDRLLKAELNGIDTDNFAAMTDENKHRIGAIEGRLDEGFINGGQISGLLTSTPTVKELFDEMIAEATGIFENLSSNFNTLMQKGL